MGHRSPLRAGYSRGLSHPGVFPAWVTPWGPPLEVPGGDVALGAPGWHQMAPSPCQWHQWHPATWPRGPTSSLSVCQEQARPGVPKIPETPEEQHVGVQAGTGCCRVCAEPCTHGQEQSCGCCAHALGARLRAQCLHTHARALSWLAHLFAHSLGVFKCIFAPLHACALLMCSLPACPFGSCTVRSVPPRAAHAGGEVSSAAPKKGEQSLRVAPSWVFHSEDSFWPLGLCWRLAGATSRA